MSSRALERDFGGLELIRIAGGGAAGTELPKNRVCSRTEPPLSQHLCTQRKHQPQSRAEQSLAEVRAAPAPAQIPGRQRGSNCQGSREQEDQKGAVQGLGSWSPKATTNMCLTLVGLISTAQMSARADRRERGKHGCPCWRIMRAASKEGAESSPRWALSHL